MDVRGYSYFMERRDSDKRWVATVAEFPELSAESRIHNRALNDLQDAVAATIVRRRRAGEAVPPPPNEVVDVPQLFKQLGLN